MKRKVLIAVASVVALLAIAAAGGWWYFFHTRAGVEFLLSRLDGLAGMKMTARNVDGTLAGPLRIGHFELDMKYVRVTADDIYIEPTPAALWAGVVRASKVTVGNALVEVKAPDEPPSDKPLRFMPDGLSLSVGEGWVNQAKVVLPNGTILDASNVAAAKGLALNEHRLHVEGGQARLPQGDVNGELTLRAQRPVGIEVQGEWRSSLGLSAPHAWHVRAQAGGTAESLTIESQLLAPTSASFSGTLARIQGDWRLEGALASERFALEPWLNRPPLNLERVALQIDGTLKELHARGSVLVPEVDAQPIRMEARGHYAERQLHIGGFALQLADSDTTANGELVVSFSSGSPNLDAQARWRNLRWPPRGAVVSPSGSVRVVGPLPFAVITSAQLNLHPSMPIALDASAVVFKESIELRRYELSVLEGNAGGWGTLALDDTKAWQLSIDGKQLNPAAFVQAWDGAIDLRMTAHGDGLGASAPWQIDIATLRGEVRGHERLRVQAYGRLGYRRIAGDDAYFARNFSASLGDNRFVVDGEYGRVNNLKWDVDIPRLDQVWSAARGKVRMLGEAHGDRATPKLRATLNAEDLSVDAWRVDGLVVHADIDVTRDAPFTVVTAARNAGLGSLVFDSLRLTGTGTTARHDLHLSGTMPAKHDAATPTIDLQAQGAFRNFEWRGVLSALKFTDHYGRQPELEIPHANATIASDRGSVQAWCIAVNVGKLCADAQWDTRRWHVNVIGDELPLNIFDLALGEEAKMEGRWQLSGQWSGGDQASNGEMRLRIADAAVMYEPVEDAQERVQLGTGQVSVTADERHWLGELRVITPGTTSLAASISIERAASLLQAPMSARLEAHTSDANVLPLLFIDLDHAAGTLDAELSATGSLAAPSFSGTIQLQRGELDLYRYNLALRAAELQATLSDNQMRFDGSGRMGAGAFQTRGELMWRDNRPRGELHLQGNDLLVADVPDYRVVASPNLRFAIDGTHVAVSGDVLIPSALLTPADLSGAVRRSVDVRLVDAPTDAAFSQYSVSSEINVRLGDDVRLKSLGLEGALAGGVKTVTRPNETARGQGELRVESGRFRAYGRDLNIERGRLLFEASPLEDPGLDILATRDIEDQTVGVYVRGTLREPRLSFYSDPVLSQSQTIAYLLTGRPIEDLSDQDTAAVGNATSSIALQGGELLASQLGRRIGLEHVSVESSGLDDTSLVLGKFLSPRLFVSYGISLTESINTFKARYRLSDRWLLKGEAGLHQSADVEFRIER